MFNYETLSTLLAAYSCIDTQTAQNRSNGVDNKPLLTQWSNTCTALGKFDKELWVELNAMHSAIEDNFKLFVEFAKNNSILRFDGELCVVTTGNKAVSIWSDAGRVKITHDDFLNGMDAVMNRISQVSDGRFTADTPPNYCVSQHGGYALQHNCNTMNCTFDMSSGIRHMRISNDFMSYHKPVPADGFTNGKFAMILYAADQFMQMTLNIYDAKEHGWVEQMYPLLVGCIAETLGEEVRLSREYIGNGDAEDYAVEIVSGGGNIYTIRGSELEVDRAGSIGSECSCILDEFNIPTNMYEYVRQATRTLTGKRPKTAQKPTNLDPQVKKSLKATFKPLRKVLQ